MLKDVDSQTAGAALGQPVPEQPVQASSLSHRTGLIPPQNPGQLFFDTMNRLADGVEALNRSLEALQKRGGGADDDGAKTAHGEVQWMTTESVAELLHIVPKTVRRLAAEGKLPGSKVSPNSRKSEWRFRVSDIEKYQGKARVVRRRLSERTIGV